MTNNSFKNSFKIMMAIIIAFLFLLTPIKNGFASEIEDLTKEWTGRNNNGVINRGEEYSSLPSSIKAVIPEPPVFKDYEHGLPYPTLQCTWYVWNRAKEFGISYGLYEGNGKEWATRSGSNSIKSTKLVPRTALSTSSFGSDSLYGHVMFIEYVDKQGNVLVSEGNVSQYYNKKNDKASFMIITSDRIQQELKAGTTHVAEPGNRNEIKNYGKNPDGSDVGVVTDSEKEDVSDKETGGNDKYVGEDAWKNKIVNFQVNAYKRAFNGIERGSNGFVNSAFISGMNSVSLKAVEYAYVAVLFITIGLFFFMAVMTTIYLVILPNGLGGYRLMDVFEKTTGLYSSVNKKNTIELLSRLGITTIMVALIYANALPILISGSIGVFQTMLSYVF